MEWRGARAEEKRNWWAVTSKALSLDAVTGPNSYLEAP